MITVGRFLTTFDRPLVCTPHCFDRVLFKGRLALASPREWERFVDYLLKVRRSHSIKEIAPRHADRLVEHAQRFARENGRTNLYGTRSPSAPLGRAVVRSNMATTRGGMIGRTSPHLAEKFRGKYLNDLDPIGGSR